MKTLNLDFTVTVNGEQINANEHFAKSVLNNVSEADYCCVEKAEELQSNPVIQADDECLLAMRKYIQYCNSSVGMRVKRVFDSLFPAEV